MQLDHFGMYPERAFQKVGGRMTLEGGGGKGSAPPAPDYTGAAQAQAQSSVETTNMANYANRPTINTPWGQQSWSQGASIDPATGQPVTTWTQNTSITPESQKALDSQMAMQQGRSDIANALMPSAQDAITNPIDYSQFSSYGAAPTATQFRYAEGDTPTMSKLVQPESMQKSFSAERAMPNAFNYSTQPMQQNVDMSGVSKLGKFDRAFVGDMLNQTLEYMRPDQERQQSSLETKLANQGLTRGSEAYNNAYRQMMDQQSRDKYNALSTAYNQGNQMYQNQLAANNQTYQQALNNANFANAAQNQSFNQQNQAWNNNFNLGNTSFNQSMQKAQFANAARQQDFSNTQATAQFNNQAVQNEFNNNMAAWQFNNTNDMNAFNQQQTIANYNNAMRQAQITEAQQRQLQPLNNINALISGQQVSMPSMPSFNANQAAQPVNYLGAAQAQGNYNMQNQQMANASQSSTIGGIGSLLGTAAGAAMMMSDRRLKRDVQLIKMIGKGKKKLGWYRYRYVGHDTWYEGVMAQEVKKVNPEAVERHHSGYDMVNYAMIGA